MGKVIGLELGRFIAYRQASGDASTKTCAPLGAWLTAFPSRLFRIAVQRSGSVTIAFLSTSVSMVKPCFSVSRSPTTTAGIGLRVPPPSDNRLEASVEFRNGKRFRQVIICAQGESSYAIIKPLSAVG
jgi:hypothetical protein